MLDGCFATVKGMFKYQVLSIPGVFADLFSAGVFFMLKMLYRYEPVDPVNRIVLIKCRVFLVYEGEDRSIPYRDQVQLKAAGCPANEFWVIPGAEPARDTPQRLRNM